MGREGLTPQHMLSQRHKDSRGRWPCVGPYGTAVKQEASRGGRPGGTFWLHIPGLWDHEQFTPSYTSRS